MNKACVGLLTLFFAALAHAQTPVVNSGGIVNTANYATGGVAPGSIVSIFGENLASSVVVANGLPLPMTLGNVQSVTFNGVQAGLYFVSQNQINAEVPWNVGGNGTATVVVTTSGGASAPQTVPIVAANPGIFTTSANGLGQGVVSNNLDNDVAAPTATIDGLSTHPVPIGGYLVIWCTGLGAVDGIVANGNSAGGAIYNTLLVPTVTIGGVKATFVYSVLSPQFAGEYQIGVQVAPNTPIGIAEPVQIEINGITTSNAVTVAIEPANATPLSVDCTLTSTACTQITINGDPYSTTGNFGGYADPSIRQDPQTGTLWMAYSYLHTISTGNQGIDTHVASSTDGGTTWNYAGDLYPAAPVTDPVSGTANYSRNEVMNLLPQVVNGTTYWYGIHSYYYVPQGGGAVNSSSEVYTKRWEMSMAPGTATGGPMGLSTATPEFLGQNINTFPQDFPVAEDLSSLNSQLTACTEFFEPTLILNNNNLYIFLSCTGGLPSQIFYAVFKTTDPQDHAGVWDWTYVYQGSALFAGLGDALSVGSYLGGTAMFITQMDLAPGKSPGTLMAVMTASFADSNGKESLGCAVAEMANIDPPAFVYNAQGQVQVDALITSSDSSPNGPGSCTYSPASSTGVIIAHRQAANAPQNNGFFSFLMQSKLMP